MTHERDAMVAAALVTMADAIDFACAANHHLAGQDPEQAQRWRDALATLTDAQEELQDVAKKRKADMTDMMKDYYAVIVDDSPRAIFKEITDARAYAEMTGGMVLAWRVPANTFKFEDEE